MKLIHKRGCLSKMTLIFWCLLLLLAGIMDVGGFVVTGLLLIFKTVFLATAVVFLMLILLIVRGALRTKDEIPGSTDYNDRFRTKPNEDSPNNGGSQ